MITIIIPTLQWQIVKRENPPQGQNNTIFHTREKNQYLENNMRSTLF